MSNLKSQEIAKIAEYYGNAAKITKPTPRSASRLYTAPEEVGQG